MSNAGESALKGAARNRGGRPAKLTAEVQAKIIGAIRAGNFRKVAARWASIGDATFRTWMRLGKEQPRGKYRAFRAAVIEAEQNAEITMVALVMQAARKDAKHAEWFLERKHPERWGRSDHHKVDANVRTTVKVNADDAVEELTRLLAGRAVAS